MKQVASPNCPSAPLCRAADGSGCRPRAPRLSPSRSQPSNVISIKAVRFQAAGYPPGPNLSHYGNWYRTLGYRALVESWVAPVDMP